MALTARRRGDNGLSAWPGYVDALSTLLMVIIFVLLVFVLAQAFLSVALSGRDKQLDRVNRQLAEVSDMLSLERGHSTDLQQSIAQLNRELAAATGARDTLTQQLASLKDQAERASTDRDTLRAERDRLAQQLADANLQARSSAARAEQLQNDLTASGQRTDAAKQDTATVARQLADARQQLGDTNAKLAARRRSLPRCSGRWPSWTRRCRSTRTRWRRSCPIWRSWRSRTARSRRLRDELEKQAQDAAARAMTEQQRRAAVEAQLADEKQLGDSAQAQIALLNQQVDELKAQLTTVAKALDLAKTQGQDKDTQIANLGQKLNMALAAKVEELQRYRSEFFGKLREVLANRPGIQIVGDRFVFQSEVLFPVGSAELTPAGVSEITALAITIKDIATEIPPDITWILRVDGHTDRQPIKGRWSVRFQLGTVGGARDHRGEVADRRRRAGRASGGDGLRRQPAARSRRYAGRLREEPAHRAAADRSVALRLLAQRVTAQILQALLAARGLRVDLHHLLPGLVGALPVLARLGDRGERLERGKAARLVLQGRLDVGDRPRRIAGGEASDRALVIGLGQVGIERDRVGEVLDRILLGISLHLTQAAAHQQRDRGCARIQPELPDLLLQRPGNLLARRCLQRTKQLVEGGAPIVSWWGGILCRSRQRRAQQGDKQDRPIGHHQASLA